MQTRVRAQRRRYHHPSNHQSSIFFIKISNQLFYEVAGADEDLEAALWVVR